MPQDGSDHLECSNHLLGGETLQNWEINQFDKHCSNGLVETTN